MNELQLYMHCYSVGMVNLIAKHCISESALGTSSAVSIL